nr:hypothetical protein [Tanacetum cinerariifolium]
SCSCNVVRYHVIILLAFHYFTSPIKESVGTYTSRVILFSTIPAIIPDTAPTDDSPVLHDETPLPTETPTIPHITPTIQSRVASRPSSPETPLSLTPTSTTPSVRQRDPSDNSPSDSSSYFSTDFHSNASSDSHSDTSSDFSSGHSFLRHSSPAQSVTKRPSYSSSSRLYHNRCKSSTDLVSLATLALRALASVRADLLPPRKRVRAAISDPILDDDIEDSNEPYTEPDIDSDIQVDINACIAAADAIAVRETSVRNEIEVEIVGDDEAEDEAESNAKGTIKVRVDPRVRQVVSNDIHESVREDALIIPGVLMQELYSHMVEIPVHRVRVIEKHDNMRLRGMLGVEMQRVNHLRHSMSYAQRDLRQIYCFRFYDRVRTMPATRSGATMTREAVNELIAQRVAEVLEARDATRNLRLIMESRDEQEDESDDGYVGGNGNGNVNGNGNDNGNGNRNGGGNSNGNGGGNDGNSIPYQYCLMYFVEQRIDIKMKNELWNLTVRGNDLPAYNQRFQELILLCTKMVPEEEDRVERTRNKTGGNEAKERAFAIGGRGTNHDSNIVMSSALLDVSPSTLDTSYARELADRRVSETNVILGGCILGRLGHSFNIDLMPVELDSFDVIIDEVLIIQGDGYNGGITARMIDDKLEKKRLEDVSIVRDFPMVFPEDFPGLIPTRQVDFQIDLVSGAARVARSPYRLTPS